MLYEIINRNTHTCAALSLYNQGNPPFLRNENEVKASERKTKRIGWNVAKRKCSGVKRGQRVRETKRLLDCFFL